MPSFPSWKQRLHSLQDPNRVEYDLSSFEATATRIRAQEANWANVSDKQLRLHAAQLREQARQGGCPHELLVDVYALVCEVAARLLGLRPYHVQIMAGIALHQQKLVEMQTGEGKTLAAVLPVCLHALSGKGVHVLTFNDYLARRDADWMRPVYQFFGLSVEAIQAGMSTTKRRKAYAADVTYATAKEAGFDFLRMQLGRTKEELVQRPFSMALIDEADSLLIDEARVPLVIAGERTRSAEDLYQIAGLVANLAPHQDWELDEHRRNVLLTERGCERVEAALECGKLHDDDNYVLLTEVNQALHAQVLLHRDVDYIIRDQQIALVDEFTGRMIPDRRWPDGLQAALEAKEGLPIQPGGKILGTITLQHFLRQYPHLSGMTATAQSAAREFKAFYDLSVVPIPPHRPFIRNDAPDLIFTHTEAKYQALIHEIGQVHASGRPILVGTASVEESELIARRLNEAGIDCEVLNARNDEAEARIIAQAGTLGAVTISTNMAGRGTDIRLGGTDASMYNQVRALGGLYVIGTNRHESRRIDDQLRGRAGRQGDPGTSRFYVSLEDDLMVRFGIDSLIPPKLRPPHQAAPLRNPIIHRETDRLQRIVEGQNYEIRKTMWRYALLVEKQRATLQQWRFALLTESVLPSICTERAPDRYRALVEQVGQDMVVRAERAILLHHIDACWAEHLALITQIREGIHLVGIGGLDPLHEFHKQVAAAFGVIHATIAERTAASFATLVINKDGFDDTDLQGPASTWTYLINDQALNDLQDALFGKGSSAFAAGAAIMTWPLLLGWAIWKRWKRPHS